MDAPTPGKTGARAELDRFLGSTAGGRLRRPLILGAAVVGILLLAVLVGLCVRGGGDKPHYATAPLVRGDLRVTVSATGNLQPVNEVEVGSELSGIITEVRVDNNDRVTRGEVLARLDTARLEDAVEQSAAALASAQAGVAQARATLSQSNATLARLEEVYRLSGGKAPAATELDVARGDQARAAANLRVAQASVGQAQATLSSNRTQLSKAIIRSPVNGVVLSRAVEPGQTVAASFNAPVLFTLAEDLSRMQLEVKVDEADVGQVKAGQPATFEVDAYPGRSFDAVVERLDLGATTTNSTSGSGTVVAYTAVLSANNPDLALRPGMTGTANIIAAQKQNVLLVPNAALRFSPAKGGEARGPAGGMLIPRRPPRSGGDQGSVSIGRGSQQTIYVLDQKGDLRPISVQVGDSNGSQTEVSGPDLRVGMRGVTSELAGEGRGGRP